MRTVFAVLLASMLGCSLPVNESAGVDHEVSPSPAPERDATPLPPGEMAHVSPAPDADQGDAQGVGTLHGSTMSLRIGAASCGDVGDLTIEIDTHSLWNIQEGYDYDIGTVDGVETTAHAGCVSAVSGHVKLYTLNASAVFGLYDLRMANGATASRYFTVTFCDRPMTDMPTRSCDENSF